MNKLRTISILGLGYVGLPLAVAFGRHTHVIGYDINRSRIADLRQGIDRLCMVDNTGLDQADILLTDDEKELSAATFHIIAVPTPVNNARQPDLEPLFSATRSVGRHLKKGDIIVYESTVYPGLTEEECLPLLETESGLKCGRDFFIGYSPERINPGDRQHTLENTVKVVSAQDQETLNIIAGMYEVIVKAGTHRAASIKIAEAAKVIENTQRDINIALMNELSLIFNRMQIDTADVLEAAGTKWNFLNFKPGLVGGHCIGVDPYYLTHKAMLLGYSPRVILSGRSINDSMGRYVAMMVVKQLIKSGINVKGVCVTILGFAFKENVPDIRNTRVVDIINELLSFDVDVQIYDPLVEKNDVEKEYQLNICAKDELIPANAVILAVAHNEFINGGWTLIQSLLKDKKGVVFDVKSALSRDTKPDGINLQRL